MQLLLSPTTPKAMPEAAASVAPLSYCPQAYDRIEPRISSPCNSALSTKLLADTEDSGAT